MKNTAVLVVMAKQPRAGSTKTRLCPPFSPEQAAAFSECLLLDTFDLAGSLPGVQLAAAITPASARAYFEHITPPGTILLPVDGADIGQCLSQSFEALVPGRVYQGACPECRWSLPAAPLPAAGA